MPFSYINVRLFCAGAYPWSAASWYSRAASVSSCGTPVPLHQPEVELRLAKSLIGGEPAQPHRFGVVLRDPGAIRVHRPEVVPSLWLAASWCTRTASAKLCGTPVSCSYINASWHCASANH